MKKITVLIITFLFLLSNNIQASFLKQFNPYSFGPEGRTVADLRDFAKPKQMANILAGRPVVATDSNGTRVYYTSDGKMCMSIKADGTTTFSVGGVSKTKDAEGNLTRVSTALRGQNLTEIKNEFGEVQGYSKSNGSGNVIEEYDEDMNLVTTYEYNDYGKNLKSSTNQMTKQKTVYDEFKRPMAVYSDDGYIIRTYQYQDVAYEINENIEDENSYRRSFSARKIDGAKTGLMTTTIDYKNVLDMEDAGNGTINAGIARTITYYDEEGLTLRVDMENGSFSDLYIYYTKDENNNDTVKFISNEEYQTLSDEEKIKTAKFDYITVSNYIYTQDTKGNKVLTSVKDNLKQTETFFENGKQQYTVNDRGAVTERHYWEGTKFLFSVALSDQGSGSITISTDNDTVNSNVYYNDNGTINSVLDSTTGDIVEKYHYIKDRDGNYIEDADGNYILDYVEDVRTGYKTYYEEGSDGMRHSKYTKNEKGEIVTDYGWNKSDLVYSFDRETKKTTWYSKEGKAEIQYETYDDRLISKKIKLNGQLIGVWTVSQNKQLEDYDKDKKDATVSTTGELTVYVNELQRVTIRLDKEPTAAEVNKIVSYCIKYKDELAKLGDKVDFNTLAEIEN